MKIMIAADMEGISGVVDRSHVDSQTKEYQRIRKIMTEDVNAAIRGAKASGADEILVVDGHGGGRNILLEELESSAELYSGSPRPIYMLTGVDADVDAVIFIGYHARAGTTNAILSHTISSVKIQNIALNDRPVGEIGLNASLCGHFNVPVLMISSDQAGCLEANEWVPGLETVSVKKACGRLAATCLPIKKAQEAIRVGAEKAVRNYAAGNNPAPLNTGKPVCIKMEFKSETMADTASLLPGTERLDGYSIQFQTEDILSAYENLGTAINLA
ncbi:MAG: M55 family metallopeptidase [Anaerolineaceae bacterium]|nr:M55 family metallopeptidase [Anaerolineaceae bacterium]